MSTPTQQQQKAIEGSGGILLSAGAGTGKTATLVNRCIRLVTESEVDIDRILMVTFTNAAAAEMRQRIREALQKKLEADPGNSRLLRQVSLLESSYISTIHS
ncbi:MAG TPA: UvrD-helicase domain-containing protein, partial [Verrucomicrobiae bacterium]|nr:UvrD-helicase domain-containing protein [Verrucomicrobiae bacterium]